MEQEYEEISERYTDQLNQLAKKIELGQTESAEKILDEITRWREDSLFRELGKLTREFHEGLQNFRLDSRISSIAEEDFPDARERLHYVITMTAQSADRSLTATENAMPICHDIKDRSRALREQWGRFTNRELSADEFRSLSKDISLFLDGLDRDVPVLEENLNEITMAQDFQDLTGQIIGRVINLVDDVEESLVNLIRLSGQHILDEKGEVAEVEEKQEQQKRDIEAQGPMVPGVDNEAEMVSGQDEVDDLLSSLGF